MKHFIYKTIHTNGKYYIGRHSTENINDGYMGSGLWPRSIKDKTSLTREILEYTESYDDLVALEEKYLMEHHGKPNCMNMSNMASGWATGSANPMSDPEVSEKISGDNHYMRKDPIARTNASIRQKKSAELGTLNLLGDRNPNKDGRNAKQAMINGTHNSITNNPSTVNAKNGTHHWQNGNSPNVGGKLNKKLIEEGRHNFLGSDLNNKRIAEGTHNLVGSDANKAMLAAGIHPSQVMQLCTHCNKEASTSMYKRWHGDNCRAKGDPNFKTAREAAKEKAIEKAKRKKLKNVI